MFSSPSNSLHRMAAARPPRAAHLNNARVTGCDVAHSASPSNSHIIEMLGLVSSTGLENLRTNE